MFEMLVKLIFWVITKISSLILTPVIALLTKLIPDLGNIITNVQYFLSHHIFTTLQWTKMFLINTLAFPTQLLSFLITVFTFLISLHAGMIIYKGAITVYQKFKP